MKNLNLVKYDSNFISIKDLEGDIDIMDLKWSEFFDSLSKFNFIYFYGERCLDNIELLSKTIKKSARVIDFLDDNFTIRIHLDDTDENNGALKVIPKSHLKGVCRPETIEWSNEKQKTCNVNKGGIMFMKPLLLHSSGRSINNNKRRVLHIEFSRSSLPENLNWAEYAEIKEDY